VLVEVFFEREEKSVRTDKLSSFFLIAAILLLSFFLSNYAIAGTIQIPKTGQTHCYDTAGNPIACAGTGHDGEIQAGVAWPTPRFAVNGNTTITDNLTGHLLGGYF
jgi:hypothetical protein